MLVVVAMSFTCFIRRYNSTSSAFYWSRMRYHILCLSEASNCPVSCYSFMAPISTIPSVFICSFLWVFM